MYVILLEGCLLQKKKRCNILNTDTSGQILLIRGKWNEMQQIRLNSSNRWSYNFCNTLNLTLTWWNAYENGYKINSGSCFLLNQLLSVENRNEAYFIEWTFAKSYK